MVSFVQINLHHCNDANDALVRYAISNNIDILICQDIYLSEGVAVGIPPEWPIFFSTNKNAAIILTNSDYALIRNLELENSVTVSLTVNNDSIYICSQYSPPENDIDKDFIDLGRHFDKFDKTIIAGDFNVPIIDFGYTRQTERTEIFLEHVLQKDLRIMNDASAPHTFVQGSLKGRPDLTLGGLDICNKLNSWYVDDNTFSFSDHRYIRFTLNYTPVLKLRTRYKTKNKNFTRFNKRYKK